jgi:hypothetical protein
MIVGIVAAKIKKTFELLNLKANLTLISHRRIVVRKGFPSGMEYHKFN